MKLTTIETARKAAAKISSQDKLMLRRKCETIKEAILSMTDELAKLEIKNTNESVAIAAIDLNDFLTESDAFEDIKKFQQILG